jgi:hypothetical protein
MVSRHGFYLATLAVVFAAGFTAWALFAPAYSSGETIVQANPEALARLAIATPLAIASAVWLLLHHACRRNLRWPRAVAMLVAWTLVAFAVVTGFSIGLFVMPVALALAFAAHLTPVTQLR